MVFLHLRCMATTTTTTSSSIQPVVIIVILIYAEKPAGSLRLMFYVWEFWYRKIFLLNCMHSLHKFFSGNSGFDVLTALHCPSGILNYCPVLWQVCIGFRSFGTKSMFLSRLLQRLFHIKDEALPSQNTKLSSRWYLRINGSKILPTHSFWYTSWFIKPNHLAWIKAPLSETKM